MILKYKNILTIGYIYPKIKRGEIRVSKFEVEFYETRSGSCPMIEFLDSVNEKMRSRILRGLTILENNGNELREPYSKKIDEEIFELRIKSGNDISRLLYFFVIGSKIIITNGHIKKKQKADKRQIMMAKKYRKDYLRRKGALK